MRILFDHAAPFFLAHGGVQIQIEQSKAALESLGVEVEPVRWWDSAQTGDLIHYFGRPSAWYIEFAHLKGFKVVIGDLLGGVGARPSLGLALQRLFIRSARTFAPKTFLYRLAWDAYQCADATVALTSWEAYLMHSLFAAPQEKLHVIPNGVDEVFFQSPVQERGRWLVCTATINAVKRVVELAQAAVLAKTPIWIIGKAYSESDPYAGAFLQFAEKNTEYIRYEGPIYDRQKLAQAYRQARGFVLLSQFESLSLSALEAAACECPLLLADRPWARSVFGSQAMFCPVSTAVKTAPYLRKFYDQAPNFPVPPKPKSWREVGMALQSLYQSVLKP